MVDMEFGMRERPGRADSRRHATRAREKLWLLPPVSREGRPTKNNITFNGQPNFVARWWAIATATAGAERGAVCYRAGHFHELQNARNNIRYHRDPIDPRNQRPEDIRRISAAGFVKEEDVSFAPIARSKGLF